MPLSLITQCDGKSETGNCTARLYVNLFSHIFAAFADMRAGLPETKSAVNSRCNVTIDVYVAISDAGSLHLWDFGAEQRAAMR
jgi:hypothetical protein